MAKCSSCGNEMSLFRYLVPGGKFKCNYCEKQYSKKVSRELTLVFASIVVALLSAFLCLGVTKVFLPSVYGDFATRLSLYWAAGIVGALVTAKVVWRRFGEY